MEGSRRDHRGIRQEAPKKHRKGTGFDTTPPTSRQAASANRRMPSPERGSVRSRCEASCRVGAHFVATEVRCSPPSSFKPLSGDVDASRVGSAFEVRAARSRAFGVLATSARRSGRSTSHACPPHSTLGFSDARALDRPIAQPRAGLSPARPSVCTATHHSSMGSVGLGRGPCTEGAEVEPDLVALGTDGAPGREAVGPK